MRRKSGFTLVELIIVVIILGILVSLGTTQYNKVIEKVRGAEARDILGMIRKAEEVYQLQTGSYSNNLDALGIEGISSSTCDTRHYFKYSVASVTATTFTATATRCVSSDTPCKDRSGSSAWTITLDQDGTLTPISGY